MIRESDGGPDWEGGGFGTGRTICAFGPAISSLGAETSPEIAGIRLRRKDRNLSPDRSTSIHDLPEHEVLTA
jgi:hypothetical protein